MILHELVRETRIGVKLAGNPKGVVISSDFLRFSVTGSRDRLDFRMGFQLDFRMGFQLDI
jgi:hypothetical protein